MYFVREAPANGRASFVYGGQVNEQKRCAHCQQLKPLEEFAFHNKVLGTRQKQCRDCMRRFNQASYNKRKEEYRADIYRNRERRRQEARQFVWEYLSTHPCVDCGESDPIVLEFDHLNAADKRKDVSELAGGRYSLETIADEMAKCVVRCANCHRRKTARDRGWFAGRQGRGGA